MVKIFLVEDEVFALRALERKIQDLGEGYAIAGTAENGLDALEGISQEDPDIIITDIRMPDMDGIAMVEKLRERHCRALPVILSGYQEFGYAKQAMRLGVQDYLLKPVDIEELRACLHRCCERLEKQKKEKNAASLLIGGETLNRIALADGGFFAVAYLIFSNPLSNSDNIIHPNVPYLACEKIEPLVTDALLKDVQIHCFDGFFSNEKVFLLSGKSHSLPELQVKFHQAAQKLASDYGQYVTVFLSERRNKKTIGTEILRCRKSAVRSVLLWDTHVVYQPPSVPSVTARRKELAEIFSMLLRQGQNDQLRIQIRRLMNQWSDKHAAAASVQADLTYLLSSVKQDALPELSFDSAFWVENLLCFSTDWEDLADSFYQLLVGLFSPAASSERQISGEEMAQQIERFLQANLSTPVTLQMLSDEMGVSKVYLCRVFKKYKDMTPMDYFNRLRMERATQMLQQYPNIPLREIADALGFNDMYYFSKVFKRITGKNPSSLRSDQ